jgi:hypothetical protein
MSSSIAVAAISATMELLYAVFGDWLDHVGTRIS